MADRPVVVQPALCFILKRYGKTDIKRLKTVTLNFYSAEVITEAKQMLLTHLENAGIDDLPHIPRRRDTEARTIKEVDDLIALAEIIDERKLFDRLPRYAADDPVDLPTLNIMDGDMFVILSKLAQMESAMSTMQFGMNTLYNMHVNCTPGSRTGLSIAPTAPNLYNHLYNHSNSQPAGSSSGGPTTAAKNSNTGKPLTSSQLCTTSTMSAAAISNEHGRTGNMMMEAGAGAGASNRWSALVDLQSGYETSADEQPRDLPFSTVLSRSARRALNREKKRRHNSSFQGESADETNVAAKTEVKKNSRKKPAQTIGRNKPADATASIGDLIPVSVAAADDDAVVAAGPLVKKAVYCVDNVSVKATEAGMEAHLAKLGIHMLTCHVVVPRRTNRERRLDIVPDNRKAFRVCIDKRYADKMMDANNWSDDVTVTEWYFNPIDKQRRTRLAADADVTKPAAVTSAAAAAVEPLALKTWTKRTLLNISDVGNNSYVSHRVVQHAWFQPGRTYSSRSAEGQIYWSDLNSGALAYSL